MVTINTSTFSGKVFSEKFNTLVFWISGENKLNCPSLPNLTDADIADCVTKTQYAITPRDVIVAVNSVVEFAVTGAPNETVQIDAGGDILDVTLDSNGRGSDTFSPNVEGVYIVKFVDPTLSDVRVKIEAFE